MVDLFDAPAYFILLRETLECTIILAVLLSLIDKLVPENEHALRKRMKKQIWIGSACGLIVSLIIGAVFIAIFYTLARNLWEKSEPIWEGLLSLVASIVMTFMSLGIIRATHWKKKWERKLQNTTESYLEKSNTGGKWTLAFLPFTVVCRESLESFVFIAGIGFDRSASSFPIPIVLGIISGFVIGWIIFRGSHQVSMRIFLVTATVFLLFIAAGLFATSISEFQEATDNPGIVIWSINCCDPDSNNFWQTMHELFGWDNESTVGTFCGYFSYWIVVIIAVIIIARRDRKSNEGDLENNEKPVDVENKEKSVDVENKE